MSFAGSKPIKLQKLRNHAAMITESATHVFKSINNLATNSSNTYVFEQELGNPKRQKCQANFAPGRIKLPLSHDFKGN